MGDGGGGDGGGGDDDGRIFPEHPSPIIHAPRDIISRKVKSLTPMFIYTYIYIYIGFPKGFPVGSPILPKQ